MRSIFAGLLFMSITCVVQAQPAATERRPARPLVFIPGIAGSDLWIDGRRAWGDVDALLHLETLRIPDGPRSVSAAPTCDPNNHDPKYVATCGPISHFAILGPIKIGVYESLFQHLETLGYKRSGPSQNLFVFAYDWRQSNFESAAALKNFFDSRPALAGKEIDIVAHSMGGLIALIFAHQYDSPENGRSCEARTACKIKTVVTLGTPYWGSTSALAVPVEGWGWLSRKLVGGTDAIMRTVLSWPALYELLPTYQGCCRLVDKDGQARALDMTQIADFRALPLMTQASGIDPSRVETALGRRAALAKLVESGFPKHIRNSRACDNIPDGLYIMAGDQNGTYQTATAKGGAISFNERRGDGTVLLRSASFGNPAGAFLSFTKHMNLFDDANVKAKLETILHRCEMSFADFNGETVSVRLERRFAVPQILPVDFVSARVSAEDETDPSYLSITGTLSVVAPDDAIAPSVSMSIKQDGLELHASQVHLQTRVRDGAAISFSYKENFRVADEGLLRIDLQFGTGGPVASDFVYILGK